MTKIKFLTTKVVVVQSRPGKGVRSLEAMAWAQEKGIIIEFIEPQTSPQNGVGDGSGTPQQTFA